MSGGEPVRFFQALGDGTRLELLMQLREGERTVGELVDTLQCPQPKVSRHLKVLREAGLVSDRRDGRHVTYALTTPKSWGGTVREWLAVLDAGFPPGASPRPPRRRRTALPPDVPRSAVPAAPAVAADTPVPAATADPSVPAAAVDPPDTPRPVARRPEMETHLL